MTPADEKSTLPELPDEATHLPELPDDVQPAGGAARADARKTSEDRETERKERARQRKQELDRAAGATGEKRQLDRAPLILRKASIVLAIASIVPFATPFADYWLGDLIGKAIIVVGAWVFYQAHRAKAGESAPGFAAGLAKNKALPGLIVFGVLCLVGLYDWSGIGYFDEITGQGRPGSTILGEKVCLILAAFTFVHIFDYEHGGKFNPLFPLMFVGAALAGIGAILIDVSSTAGPTKFVSAAAAVAVTFAGAMAVNTMVVAMKEAKRQGELKKQAQLEARKAAREARQTR